MCYTPRIFKSQTSVKTGFLKDFIPNLNVHTLFGYLYLLSYKVNFHYKKNKK